ncbi:MAG: MGMT family protein [Candidatus Auribacterota bacterium]
MFRQSLHTETLPLYQCPTTAGIFGVMLSGNVIKALFFPAGYPSYKITDASHSLVEKLSHDLNYFFDGHPVDWSTYSIDLSSGTDYQRAIWRTLQTIPYGTCWSYGEVAGKAGFNGARAVGNACNKNPIPIIIPCHRVIHKSNKLGGFGSGIKWKQFLLCCEGLRHENDKLFYSKAE